MGSGPGVGREKLAVGTCGNALLPGSYPEDGPVVGSVTRRVLQDGLAAPGHRLTRSRISLEYLWTIYTVGLARNRKICCPIVPYHTYYPPTYGTGNYVMYPYLCPI